MPLDYLTWLILSPATQFPGSRTDHSLLVTLLSRLHCCNTSLPTASHQPQSNQALYHYQIADQPPPITDQQQARLSDSAVVCRLKLNVKYSIAHRSSTCRTLRRSLPTARRQDLNTPGLWAGRWKSCLSAILAPILPGFLARSLGRGFPRAAGWRTPAAYPCRSVLDILSHPSVKAIPSP